MDTKRLINTRLWSDAWFETLNPTEKLIWIYFLTNSYTNMLGIYQISIKRVIFETGVNDQTLSKALEGFERVKKCFFWFDNWVFLPNWIKNQSMNTNMVKCAMDLFDRLPNELIIKLEENGFKGFESLSNGSQTLPEIERRKGKGEREISLSDFDRFWEEYHKLTKKPKEDKTGAIKKWKTLTDQEREKAIEMIPAYSKTNEPKYLKMARNYLDLKSFDNEMTLFQSKDQPITQDKWWSATS